eukprot:14879160-Alexandrium_andersonii.AAC.1
MQELRVRSAFVNGIGEERTRQLSIPQGCPFSMTLLGLLGAGWINFLRDQFASSVPRCLADDLLVETWGQGGGAACC